MSAPALEAAAAARPARTCSRALHRARPHAQAPRPAARERDPWLGGVAVTAVVHAALLAALLHLRTPAPALPPTPPAAAVVLELSLLPKAPPVPALDLPPGPAQPERAASRARPPREVARDRPLPQPPQALGETASAPQPAASSAPAEQPAAQDQAAASASAPPTVAAVPAPRYAAAQDAAGAGRQVPRHWQQLLLGHLERFKRYPRQARRLHQQGVAQLRMSVAGDGRVRAARIEASSGYPGLDEEALAVAQRAGPVPAPPAELGDPVEVVVPVDFYIAR
ncbi:protein TonB [Lysobacter sp. yr284]|uniref:energy transducer TonB n=1 Tax=Lysobacter sp. yr284 TaxID=1761791 RepID=UPI0008954E83|nr:TonB family protein [Lysobacter sp. yr284]SDY81581.1 protein TonB [Lysobacter sp. yr284]